MRRFLKVWLKVASQIYIFRYKPFIIAITGNTGKTSTKEALGVLLENAFPDKNIRKSLKNLNTDIGVPLSILALKDARNNLKDWCFNLIKSIAVLIYDKYPADYLILELAADKPGEIKYFAKFIKIDIGVITSIGKNPVHLEFFKNRDELIAEKAWIIKGIKNQGSVILNYDDVAVRKIAQLTKGKAQAMFYGKNERVDLQFILKKYELRNKQIKLQGIIKHHNLEYKLEVKNVIGEGSLYVLTAALLVGKKLNISLKKGVKILSKYYKTPPGRMRILVGVKNTIIVDDSYNASPLAFENAIKTIKYLEGAEKYRKIGVLGDMAELGDQSSRIHKHIFQFAQEVFDVILCVGPQMIKAFQQTSQENILVYQADNSALAKNEIKKILKKDDLILVKGAQVMRMEKIVKALMKSPERAKKLLVRQEKHWISNES